MPELRLHERLQLIAELTRAEGGHRAERARSPGVIALPAHAVDPGEVIRQEHEVEKAILPADYAPKTFAEQLFFVTCQLVARHATQSTTATGFVYRVPTTGGKSVPLLVTNKHVISDAKAVTVRMIQGNGNGGPRLGQSVEVTLEIASGSTYVIGHPDPDVDVACMPIQPLVRAMENMGKKPYFKSIGPDLVPSAADIGELDAIEPVYFAGYPAGIYDKFNLTPVVRQAMSATPLQLDYGGIRSFLIDGSVFPGSSGSPVFLNPATLSIARGGERRLGGRKPYLLGILAAVHAVKVGGVVTDVRSVLTATFDQLLNLGIVYKTSAIDDLATIASRQFGFERASDVEESAA